ncbi:MAG: Radical SAM domain-containing protein [Promethearchaeota archaeon CR_4]|nr:MAG: Radical SAM domain-containing protein [Candidatus Lokiarchaeota archaeon CR_4]
MHVLLINPLFTYVGRDKFPLGLGYVATIALKEGHHMVVVDENLGETIPWEQLGQFKLIGLSVTTPALPRARSLITQLRIKKSTEALIVAGGHHPTFRPKELLQIGVDVVVRGEGEVPFAQILRISNPLSTAHKWKNILGISYYDDSGNVQHNTQLGLTEDLDHIPFPAWDVFRYKNYSPMSVITSRGCPYRCNYCAATAFWQHYVRYRSIANVVAELDALLALHTYHFIKFQDSVFTSPRKRVLDLMAAIIEKNYPFQWTCETRADALDHELIDMMARAKCKTIMLGLESGSQGVLDQNERKMKVSDFVDTCQNIKQRGLGIRVSVVFGLPGETPATVEDTLTILRSIQPNVTFLNLATAYPGCALEHHPVASHKEQWVTTFGGHGVGGQLILPVGMTPKQYHKLADYLYGQIHELNKVNWVKENQDLL